jgi:two-component system sensor kinase FixL
MIAKALVPSAVVPERAVTSPQTPSEPDWRGRLFWPSLALFEISLPVADGERYWSPEFYELLGLQPGATVPTCQQLLEAIVVPEDRERVAEAQLQAEREGRGMEVEFRIQRPDGDRRHLQAITRLTPSGPDGRRRLVGLLRDLTEDRDAEDAAYHLRERVLAVGRWSLLGELASGLAHELNQPLAAITTFAQAGVRLLDQASPDLRRARAVLDDIASQALRAGDVIRRMRSLIRSQKAEKALVDCNALVQDFMVLAEPMARAHDVRVTLDLAPAVPPVEGDSPQLQQLLMILFRNAIDAVQGGAVSAAGREVGVVTRVENGAVCISVLDRGPGVPEAVARELFRPFFSTKADGTGLGLAICRNIAGQHSGDLYFENRPDGGARFWVRLPVARRPGRRTH